MSCFLVVDLIKKKKRASSATLSLCNARVLVSTRCNGYVARHRSKIRWKRLDTHVPSAILVTLGSRPLPFKNVLVIFNSRAAFAHICAVQDDLQIQFCSYHAHQDKPGNIQRLREAYIVHSPFLRFSRIIHCWDHANLFHCKSVQATLVDDRTQPFALLRCGCFIYRPPKVAT